MNPTQTEQAHTALPQQTEVAELKQDLHAQREAALTQNLGHNALVQMPDGTIATGEELAHVREDNQEVTVPRR
jgi:hypothetical protein